MGLPSKHRLKRRSDFKTVYQQGVRRYSRHLILRAVPIVPESLDQPSPTKIAVSVSRKVNKKAVVRNRLKRLVKASFLSLLPQISPNWLMVVILKKEAQECKYEHFLRELEELLIKLKIIYGN